MNNYALVIHGGAGTLVKGLMTPEKESRYTLALQTALARGYKLLEDGKTAMDAVQAAVIALEDTPLFNAGRGAVFTADGTHEMDAAVMNGADRKAGAVTLVSGIKNPISLARDVMDHSQHVFLAGEGAMRFAASRGYELQPADYFYDQHRYEQWQNIKDSDTFQLDHSMKKEGKFGTVGAVAVDMNGHVAAATSTGGMTNKRWGRVGDSPLVGCGTYANDATCAVSCTGSGEFFIRGVVAYDVSCLMEYKGMSLQEAADTVINDRVLKIEGDGGLIAVDSKGNIAMPFNTEGMYRAARSKSGYKALGIYKELIA